jgi:hypothetical protein
MADILLLSFLVNVVLLAGHLHSLLRLVALVRHS